MSIVKIGDVPFGNNNLGWIVGPCMLESESIVRQVAEQVSLLRQTYGNSFVFKGSFDKANRTAGGTPRGPGLDEGLKLLEIARSEFNLPLITDIHEADQAQPASEIVDAIQIPAFLCRQTSLIEAAAATKKPLLIKRGQFMAPGDMHHAVSKASEAPGVLLAERGSSFGYNDLIVDFRALPVMRQAAPVVFDATHSVQKPGAAGGSSGGAREFLVPLARAAVAVGIDGIFIEAHPDPAQALSDKQTQLPLDQLNSVVSELSGIHSKLYG